MAELSAAQVANVPRITRAARTVPSPEPPAEEDGAIMSAAKSVGSAAMSGLSMVGNLLDLPGSMVRDALVWDNPLDQFLDPLSHSDTGRSASGRDVLSRNLLTSWLFTPNKETGMSGWLDDPMEGVQDLLGFGVELATDPLSWLSGGVAKAPGALGDLSKAITSAPPVGKWGKLEKGLQIANELDPGTHVGRALGIPQALAARKVAKTASAVRAADRATNPFTAATGTVDDFVRDTMAGVIPKDGTPLSKEYEQFAANHAAEINDAFRKAASSKPMAERALDSIVSGYETARAKAGETADSLYAKSPESVQKVASWMKTEAGLKSDALRRWALSAFDHDVDGRMNQTGQTGAKVAMSHEDDTLRWASGPVMQALTTIQHYGPDGTNTLTGGQTAALRTGQTVDDWHNDFGEAMVRALEAKDPDDIDNAVKYLDDLMPGKPLDDGTLAPGPFVEVYNALRKSDVEMLKVAQDAGVVIGDYGDVIRHNYRQMNQRLSDWREARELPSTGGTGKVTREDLFRGFYHGTGGGVTAGVNAVTSDKSILDAVRAAQYDIPDQKITKGPEQAGANVAKVIEANDRFAGNIERRMPLVKADGSLRYTNPAIGVDPETGIAKQFNITPSDLEAYYYRVPNKTERGYSIANGDQFDLALGDAFDMTNELHRAVVFRNKLPLEYRRKPDLPETPETKDLVETIHQVFEDRWEKIGRYMWGSDDSEAILKMQDHTQAIEANGGIFGRHFLINKQRYNHLNARKIGNAKAFTDVFESGIKSGDIRHVTTGEAMTGAARAKTVDAGEQGSVGVPLGKVFDQLEGLFNREKIYANAYERLRKEGLIPDEFMVKQDIPDDMIDELSDMDMDLPATLNTAALRKYMDNLTVDNQLARELQGLHHAYHEPGPAMKWVSNLMRTFTAQFKAGVLSVPATQSRNWSSAVMANIYSNAWSPTAQANHSDALFNRPSEFFFTIPEVRKYAESRGMDMSDPMSGTRAYREMYAIEKDHLASETRDFTGQANTMDNIVDLDHMLNLLPGVRSVTSAGFKKGGLMREYIATLAGRREGTSWKDPFDIAGTVRVFGNKKTGAKVGSVRRESHFTPVVAINMIGKVQDDSNRMVPHLELMRQGMSSREAFRRANQIQLNYDPRKFTDLERTLKSIFPFYSFFSRESAYLINELMTNPAGKLGKLIRLHRHMQTDDNLPEHITEGGAIPLPGGQDGTKNYLTGLGLMFEDPIKTFVQEDPSAFGRSLLSKMNPLIKGGAELSLGRSSFQGGPLGGRDLADMDPLLGRIFTQLGLQDPRPDGNAKPAFGSPTLEFALSNSPLSRILSQTRTALDSPERKSILNKAAILLTGMRITSVSPEQRQRGLREALNARAKELGARPFTTLHISRQMLDAAKAGNDPELYQEMLAISNKRKGMDRERRIKLKAKKAVTAEK